MLLLMIAVSAATAQKSDRESEEIKSALALWNNTAREADLNKFMTLFDTTAKVVLVGSDSAEVFIGKEQVRSWLGQLFGMAGFEWQMKLVEIDHNKNTGWIFAEGEMVVTFKETGKQIRKPYRFTGILVKKDNQWKWRLFNGSSWVSGA